VKVLVHGDAVNWVSGKLRTVVTTASHLELMYSCDLRVGIWRVVSFTPSMPVAAAVADVRDSMPRLECKRCKHKDSSVMSTRTIMISVWLVIVMPRLVNSSLSLGPRRANQDCIDRAQEIILSHFL
jgi:hypothetical protein